MIDHVYRGQEAERLLNDPFLKEIFAELEKDYFEQAMTRVDDTSPMADEQRRRLLVSVKCLRDVRQQLQSLVTTGRETVKRARRESGEV